MSDADHTSDPIGDDLDELLDAALDAAEASVADRFDAQRFDHRYGVERCEYGCAITLAEGTARELAQGMLTASLPVLLSDLRTAEARATAAEVASRGYRERAEKAERERDAALRTVDEHRCDGQAERAYKRAIHAEAERDALAERAEAAEAKAARFAGLLGHQSRTLTDTIAAETTRQKADAWDEGYTSGHSRAMRRMSDEPNVEPGTNPYRAATPPTTTEETTHE